jgi:hypothetical protein
MIFFLIGTYDDFLAGYFTCGNVTLSQRFAGMLTIREGPTEVLINLQHTNTSLIPRKSNVNPRKTNVNLTLTVYWRAWEVGDPARIHPA